MPEKLNHLPAWVLEEGVDVTLVFHDPDAVRSIYLVEHVSSIDCEDDGDHGRSAVTLEFNSTDRILVNGMDIDLSDDMIAVCSLVDDANSLFVPGDPESALPVGMTVHSEPYHDPEPTTWRAEDHPEPPLSHWE